MRAYELFESSISVDNVPESVRSDIITFLLSNAPVFKEYWISEHGVMSFNETYVAQFLFGYELRTANKSGYDSPIRIRKIKVIADDIIGKSVDDFAVKKYAEMSSKAPPILVYKSSNGWKCAEGGHRLAAAKLTGSEIDAYDVTNIANASYDDWVKWEEGSTTQSLVETTRDRQIQNVVAYPDLVPEGTKAGLLTGRPMNSREQAIYAVRKVSREELDDAIKAGEFLMPPTGSTKHGVGKKWWSPADDQGLFGRDWSKGSGGAVVRVPMSEFKPNAPISVRSAQIWNEQSRTWNEIN